VKRGVARTAAAAGVAAEAAAAAMTAASEPCRPQSPGYQKWWVGPVTCLWLSHSR